MARHQTAILAEQIPGARVYRVDKATVAQYMKTGAFPEGLGPGETDMLKGVKLDTAGLGKGELADLIRIYRGQ